MPTHMSTKLTQAHNYTMYTIHILLISYPLLGAHLKMSPNTFLKTNTTFITLSLTLPISTTYSHRPSFTITATPPTQSPFPDHNSSSLHPNHSRILSSPPHLQQKHTSTIIFFSSSQNSHFPLNLPIFHIPTCSQSAN